VRPGLAALAALAASRAPALEALLEEKTVPPPKTAANRRAEPLVDVAKACPGVFIELRYATARNLAGRALYPRGARCLLRKRVAAQLSDAQAWLRRRGYALKVWDAYRPAAAHRALWAAAPNPQMVGNPAHGGSFHMWGVAVDATLVDAAGRALPMPTDFDVLTPAASKTYRGGDPAVARHLRLLQEAMHHAGFLGIRDEWWHFVSRDYFCYGPLEEPL
jgi:D-alanyl-D-alanine dipeptidase